MSQHCVGGKAIHGVLTVGWGVLASPAGAVGGQHPRVWWLGPLGFLCAVGLTTTTTVLGMVPEDGEGMGVRETQGSHTHAEVSFNKLLSHAADAP